jgi:transglutaminase-like putative cysteine protease
MMRKHDPRFLYLTTVLLFVTLSCSLLAPAPTAVPVPPTDLPATPKSLPATPSTLGGVQGGSTGVQVSTPQGFSGTPVPLEVTPVKVTVDNISVDYVYTNNLITSLYHLYGTVLDHFVDITLTNDGPEPARILVRSEVTDYTTSASDTVDVPANGSVEIHQDPRLVPDAVDKLNSQKPGNFHIHIAMLDQGQEKVILDESHEILLYSRRDFVWVPGFETQEEYDFWAAWVTPTDPSVEALIRKAANYDSTGIIVGGYGDGTLDQDGSVWRRLEAVWKAESDYNLTYIDTEVAFGPSTVQRMRLPSEVLDQASGNCVELAALYASVAEAMGLETAIVRIPGHAFTAVRMDQENARYYFIETTMIGRASFSDAVKKAAQEWADNQPHFDAKEEGYAWVNIPDARKNGILPIPWK